MGSDIPFESASSVAERIRSRDVSPTDVVDAYLERIAEYNDDLNAYVSVLEDDARAAAAEAERAIENGDRLGPLHGVPVAIKDNTDVAGAPTTNGTKLLTDNVPDEDDVIVERLRDAGAIVLGKTNMPAFALGPGTDNELVGPARNPWDLDENAGGSSGGSASAVATGLAPIAHGTDGGGSIRHPACSCGVFGFKPSARRIPLTSRPDGFGNSIPWSHAGPITRTVTDAALMMNVLAGYHPRDPYSLPDSDIDYVDATTEPIDELSIAYAPTIDGGPVDSDVRELCTDAVESLEQEGATIEETTIDIGLSREEIGEATAVLFHTRIAASVEAMKTSHGIDILGSDRDHVRPMVISRIEDGQGYSGVDIRRAERVRTRVFDAVQDVFAEHDVLLLPTLTVPTRVYSYISQEMESTDETIEIDGEELPAVYAYRIAHLFNLSGHPAASLPAGFTDDGLPVGLQVVGSRYGDRDVLAASASLEEANPWIDTYSESEIPFPT